ncbi:hypothetical protein WMF04_04860 [Sorangium sp. So ce260]|uniref:hypothetical protein n=1 Tax=Sorangium sp. So ce260 TaxID=3133291 RepID=UPI003F63A46A
MRSFFRMSLWFSLSISSVLAGTGCLGPAVSDQENDKAPGAVAWESVEPGAASSSDEAPPGLEPGSCLGGELGDGFTCTDSTVLKDAAHGACVSIGAELSIFEHESSNRDCAGYEATRARFSCCLPKLPPPPPPPAGCWGGELGDGSVCIDSSVLKDRAYRTCVSEGAELAAFDYERNDPRCAGYETSKSRFLCCPPEPPPPPPAECWGGELGDGSVCIDSSVLKDRAYRTCVSEGAELAAFDYERNDPRCAGYETSKSRFLCCPPEPPPPEEPPCHEPEPCWTGELGDLTVCVDSGLLRQRASETCASRGGELTDFVSQGDDPHCADGEMTMAKFACCAAPPPVR